MKKLLLVAAAFIFSLTTFAQQTADDVMKVNTEKFDFGKIKQGVPVSTYFELKNTSDKPLVVETVYASCGCTTPEKPTEPIQPGATYKLKVNYNAAGMGHFEKDVTIKLAGIETPKVVKITGDVVADQSVANTQTKPNPVTATPAVTNSNTNSQTKTEKAPVQKTKTTTKTKTAGS